jgi:hypothetical protein
MRREGYVDGEGEAEEGKGERVAQEVKDWES